MPSDTLPAVSIIMPVYNSEMTVETSVASVLAQSFTDWELILIDDGSQDRSADLCAELVQQDVRIRFAQQAENRGAAVARNAGLALAQGRYVAFLDADDLWHEDKLHRQIGFMRDRGAVFSYTGFWRQPLAQDGGANTDRRHHVRVPGHVTRAELLRGNVIGCLTAVYDRAHFGTVAFPLLRMRQDFALWLLLLSQCERAYGLDEPLAVHHVNPQSLSSVRGRAMQATWHLYRQHLGLSTVQAAWYMSNHLMRRVWRG